MRIFLRLVGRTKGASGGAELVVAESPAGKTPADRDRLFDQLQHLLADQPNLKFTKTSTTIFVSAPLLLLTPQVVKAVKAAFDRVMQDI